MRLLFSVKEAVRLLQRNRDNSAVLSVGAVDECVKELVGLSNNPLLVRPREEGWTRRQEKWRAKPRYLERTGGRSQAMLRGNAFP